MRWNPHSETEGTHAFLSASKYSWLNYDEQKLKDTYLNFLATMKGTELHEFAHHCIRLGIKLENKKETLNMFVNDCIDYCLQSEQQLYYSDLCYGTADAIGLDSELNTLRVFDLKTGTHKASMPQLEIYAALFCLEYQFQAKDISAYDLRIYQNNQIHIEKTPRDRIEFVINKIIDSDRILREIR